MNRITVSINTVVETVSQNVANGVRFILNA